MKTHRIPLGKDVLIEQGFEDFYHYHGSFFRKYLFRLLFAAFFGICTIPFLVDANFQFGDHWESFRCHGNKGCGIVVSVYFLALVFFSLPIWLKLPSAIVFAINGVFGFLKKMVHYFDRKPDLAVGKNGIYCADWFYYQEIGWQDVEQIEINRKLTSYGSFLSENVKIKLRKKNKSGKGLFRSKNRYIEISRTWKTEIANIIESLKKFKGETSIVEYQEIARDS
jgi:hypothetical protein